MVRDGHESSKGTPAEPIAVALAVIGVVGLVLVVSFALAISRLLDWGPRHRRHLKPIPIAAAACSYVDTMHSAANAFQTAMPIFGAAFDAHGALLTWPQTRTRLRRATDRFDAAIATGMPHFPAQVGYLLQVVRNDMRAGRVQLREAHDGFDFYNRTTKLFDHGQLAFGYAGDLIGHQCAVPLGADDDTMFYPFGTTTTTAI